MSGEGEIVSESVPSEDLVPGNGNDKSLQQIITGVVENLMTEKFADFKNEINDSVQATINKSLAEFRAQDAPARQESVLHSREENVHPKTDVAGASSKEDLSYWKKIAEDELKSAKETQLKNLNGMHTIICIDTSASMKENQAWEQAKTFFTDYMTGIKEENLQKRKHSNTALVTFGKETKVQQRLTKDVKVLEQKMDDIQIGGPSPMLAGLMLAKASATVSNFRFAMVNYMPIPPRIIIITDGKATGVNDIMEFDEEPNKDKAEVRQQIIEEITAILKEEIEVHFVYVGKPDIVFLHELQEISRGELVPYTSGRKMAKDVIFKCILQRDKDLLTKKEKKHKKKENEGTKDDKEKKEGKEEKSLEEGAPLSSALAELMAKKRRMLKKLLGSTDGSSDSDSSDSSDDSDKDTERDHFLEFLRKKHGSPDVPSRLDLEEHLDRLKQKLEDSESSIFADLKKMVDHMKMGQDFYEENPEMQKYAPIGSRVKRGRDWRWGNQDKGGPGTIIGHSYDELKKYWCWVEWDTDGEINAYRWNMNGKCDLTIVEEERVPIEGKILAVGSRIIPGDAFKGDKLHEEGIVIKLIDDNKAQVRWANDGSREELSFGNDGSPKEIEPVITKDSRNKSDDSENVALAVNKTEDVHSVACEEPNGTHQLLSLPTKCLEVYDVYENTASLKWQKPVDDMDITMSKYIVTYGETSNPQKRTVIEVNSTLSCTLDDLKAGSEYVAEVKLVSNRGESLPVTSDSFTTMETDNDDSHYAGWKLTDRDAARLTSAIGENWEMLGPELGVGKIPLHRIKQDNQSSALCIYQMLLNWVSNHPNPTFGKFTKGLKKYPEVSVDRKVIDTMKEEFRLMEMQKSTYSNTSPQN